MTSITEAMIAMPEAEQRAYKQGVEAGVGLMLDLFVARWTQYPEVQRWALDNCARWSEMTT